MEVLTNKYPGIILICEQCGALLGNIQPQDIYGANFVYCPLCKHQNLLEYDRNYNGIIEKEKAENVSNNTGN